MSCLYTRVTYLRTYLTIYPVAPSFDPIILLSLSFLLKKKQSTQNKLEYAVLIKGQKISLNEQKMQSLQGLNSFINDTAKLS